MSDCICQDCLAHRDPDTYGDKATMVAAIDLLREALDSVLHQATANARRNIRFESDHGRVEAFFELPHETKEFARTTLERTKKWK